MLDKLAVTALLASLMLLSLNVLVVVGLLVILPAGAYLLYRLICRIGENAIATEMKEQEKQIYDTISRRLDLLSKISKPPAEDAPTEHKEVADKLYESAIKLLNPT